MEKINTEKCIELMKEKFPNFLPYWESALGIYFELDDCLSFKLIPLGKYAVDVIKSKDAMEMKKVFDFVEFSLLKGDETVQNAVATCFLEYLLSKDPDEIQFSKFVQYMGKEAIEYCKAWDEFTGVRTKGLW